MDDEVKSKAQLVEEVNSLRTRVEELERKVREFDDFNAAPEELQPSRSQRRDLPTNIHVIGDFNLIQGRGINVSDTGICFEINYDIPFEMEFELDGTRQQQRAHLVWMRQNIDGRNQLGFTFVESDNSPLFELLR